MFDDVVKEQKQIREILERLEKTGTLKEVFESYPVKKLESYTINADPWDYEDTKNEIYSRIGRNMLKLCEIYAELNALTSYMDDLYKSRVDAWKKHIKKRGPHSKVFRDIEEGLAKDFDDFYSNPVCHDFFRAYEKDHGLVSAPMALAQERLEKRRS